MSHPLPSSGCAKRPSYSRIIWRLAGLLLIFGSISHRAQANYGFYQTYAILKANAGNYQYLAGGFNNDNNASFNGTMLGTFAAGNTLVLGGEVKTSKDDNDNVLGGDLYYRVYLTGKATPSSPAYSGYMLAFSNNNVDGVNGRQKWTNVNNSNNNNSPTPVDLLSGLTVTGNYTVEVYWQVRATAGTMYDSNFGNNFKATFDYTAPLPVTLTAFTAQRQGPEALLSWTTAHETNNAGYEVQASTDGQAFQKLGFVAPAAATSATTHSYTFRDAETGKAGLRYYRLRQVDVDGSSTFSPVHTVQFEGLAAVSFAATPNPFGGSLTLRLELPQASPTATLTLTDALGRVVLHHDLGALPAGVSQAALPQASQLPAGVYVARLVLATGTQLTKVVKE